MSESNKHLPPFYVIYNKETTYYCPIYRGRGRGAWLVESFATERAAKAALTRALKNPKMDTVTNRDDWAIAEKEEFHRSIEKTKIVKAIMTGKDVTLPVNTPACCDPSYELYYSM
jgi:hypothetical protein